MTKADLHGLPFGATLHHKTATNADGSPMRCRVNGKLRLWKRDPDRFQLPVKYGLKTCFYITAANINDWELPEC